MTKLRKTLEKKKIFYIFKKIFEILTEPTYHVTLVLRHDPGWGMLTVDVGASCDS